MQVDLKNFVCSYSNSGITSCSSSQTWSLSDLKILILKIMRILYKPGGQDAQYNGDRAASANIISIAVNHQNMLEFDSVLAAWSWGWGTLSADFIDLEQWIDVLNKIDEYLRFVITEFGDRLLVSMMTSQTIFDGAETIECIRERDLFCINAVQLATTILSWTSTMLKRAIHKHVYNSVEVS